MQDRRERPLSGVPSGASVVLRRIRAGRELEARLTAMGFVAGERVTVCRNAVHGPLVVSVKGSRVMLGRGMAEQVAVG